MVTVSKPVDLSNVDLRIGEGKGLLPESALVFKAVDSKSKEEVRLVRMDRRFTINAAEQERRRGNAEDFLVQYGAGGSKKLKIADAQTVYVNYIADLGIVDLSTGSGKEMLRDYRVFGVVDISEEPVLAVRLDRRSTVDGAADRRYREGKAGDFLVQYGIGTYRMLMIVDARTFHSAFHAPADPY